MSKKLPKKLVKGWSCYQGASTEVKALHVSLTLALAVRKAPMRDRHWRALGAACGIHFDGTDGHKPPPFPHVPLSAILDFHVSKCTHEHMSKHLTRTFVVSHLIKRIHCFDVVVANSVTMYKHRPSRPSFFSP